MVFEAVCFYILRIMISEQKVAIKIGLLSIYVREFISNFLRIYISSICITKTVNTLNRIRMVFKQYIFNFKYVIKF